MPISAVSAQINGHFMSIQNEKKKRRLTKKNHLAFLGPSFKGLEDLLSQKETNSEGMSTRKFTFISLLRDTQYQKICKLPNDANSFQKSGRRLR